MEKTNHLSLKRKSKKASKKVAAVAVPKPLTGKNPELITSSTGQIMKKKKGILKKAGKKIGKAIKTGAKGVAKGLQKGVKGLGQAAKAVSLAPLIPLMPVMGSALKKKGIAPPKKVEDRAELFYNTIVVKNSYDLKPIEFRGDDYDSHLAVDIVVKIIDYFRTIKQRKQAGQKLDATEQIIAGGVEVVENKIRKDLAKRGITKQEIEETASDIPDTNMKGAKSVEETVNEKFSLKKGLLIGGGVLATIVIVVLLAKK